MQKAFKQQTRVHRTSDGIVTVEIPHDVPMDAAVRAVFAALREVKGETSAKNTVDKTPVQNLS